MTKKRSFAMLFALVLVVAACGSDTDQGSDTTTAPDTEQETTTTAAAEEPVDGVHASETDLGTILVDPDGFTLYAFTVDSPGESACYDACAELWPPVSADTPIGADLSGSNFGTTTRTDGTEQLTVNDQPLYLYTPDANPGDTNGQGFNDVWFVVDVNGNMIGSPEASTSTGSDDDDLDY